MPFLALAVFNFQYEEVGVHVRGERENSLSLSLSDTLAIISKHPFAVMVWWQRWNLFFFFFNLAGKLDLNFLHWARSCFAALLT